MAVWAGSVAAFVAPSDALAGRQAAGRTLSIDSGYIPPLATNRSMWNLWMEYEYLGASIFDWVGDGTFVGGNFLTRGLWTLVAQAGWYFLNGNFFVANHELGHGTRVIALGGAPYYSWNGGGGRHLSIITFVLEGYLHLGSGAFTSGGATYGGSLPSGWDVVVSAGGMNNSTMFGEALEDEVYYNTGHVNQIAAYLHAKMDAYNYGRAGNAQVAGNANDVTNIVASWQARGYPITGSDVSAGGLTALLANFTTYAYAWSVLRYVATGDPNVTAFSLGRWKLPDLSFFENRNGLSYRLRSAVDSGATLLPFSAEYVYLGKPTLELSFGIRSPQRIGDIRKTGSLLQAYGNTEGGVGFRASKDFPAGPRSFYSLEGSVFTTRSLEGERNMGRLVDGVGIEVAARWAMTY